MLPVAYARRPLSEASASPIEASSTAQASPTSRPGIRARVWAQIAAPPCAWPTMPRYSSSSGISSRARQARMNAPSLAAG